MGETILRCCQRGFYSVKTSQKNFRLTKICKAENKWIKREQLESFLEEMHQLMKGHSVGGARLLEHTPKLESDGAMRFGECLHLAPDMNINVKRPYIIDPKHRFMTLLIQFYYEKI